MTNGQDLAVFGGTKCREVEMWRSLIGGLYSMVSGAGRVSCRKGEATKKSFFKVLKDSSQSISLGGPEFLIWGIEKKKKEQIALLLCEFIQVSAIHPVYTLWEDKLPMALTKPHCHTNTTVGKHRIFPYHSPPSPASCSKGTSLMRGAFAISLPPSEL